MGSRDSSTCRLVCHYSVPSRRLVLAYKTRRLRLRAGKRTGGVLPILPTTKGPFGFLDSPLHGLYVDCKRPFLLVTICAGFCRSRLACSVVRVDVRRRRAVVSSACCRSRCQRRAVQCSAVVRCTCRLVTRADRRAVIVPSWRDDTTSCPRATVLLSSEQNYSIFRRSSPAQNTAPHAHTHRSAVVVPPRRLLCVRIYYRIVIFVRLPEDCELICFAETVIIFTASRAVGPRRLCSQAVGPSTSRPVEQHRRAALTCVVWCCYTRESEINCVQPRGRRTARWSC